MCTGERLSTKPTYCEYCACRWCCYDKEENPFHANEKTKLDEINFENCFSVRFVFRSFFILIRHFIMYPYISLHRILFIFFGMYIVRAHLKVAVEREEDRKRKWCRFSVSNNYRRFSAKNSNKHAEMVLLSFWFRINKSEPFDSQKCTFFSPEFW